MLTFILKALIIAACFAAAFAGIAYGLVRLW